MATARELAKAKRRKELLTAAATIMAEKGFHQTRLGDVGAAAGISGPGIYRHFASKDELLSNLLIEISVRLVDGAREAFRHNAEEDAGDPQALINDLIARHVEVAVKEPDIIRVQGREIENLEEEAKAKVKSLQRTYLALWADALQRSMPDMERSVARLRVQLVAGLINSARYVVHWAGEDMLRAQTTAMARAAFLVDAEGPPAPAAPGTPATAP